VKNTKREISHPPREAKSVVTNLFLWVMNYFSGKNTEISHTSNEVEIFQQLPIPTDLLLLIFSYLPLIDLYTTVLLVCKEWNKQGEIAFIKKMAECSFRELHTGVLQAHKKWSVKAEDAFRKKITENSLGRTLSPIANNGDITSYLKEQGMLIEGMPSTCSIKDYCQLIDKLFLSSFDEQYRGTHPYKKKLSAAHVKQRAKVILWWLNDSKNSTNISNAGKIIIVNMYLEIQEIFSIIKLLLESLSKKNAISESESCKQTIRKFLCQPSSYYHLSGEGLVLLNEIFMCNFAVMRVPVPNVQYIDVFDGNACLILKLLDRYDEQSALEQADHVLQRMTTDNWEMYLRGGKFHIRFYVEFLKKKHPILLKTLDENLLLFLHNQEHEHFFHGEAYTFTRFIVESPDLHHYLGEDSLKKFKAKLALPTLVETQKSEEVASPEIPPIKDEENTKPHLSHNKRKYLKIGIFLLFAVLGIGVIAATGGVGAVISLPIALQVFLYLFGVTFLGMGGLGLMDSDTYKEAQATVHADTVAMVPTPTLLSHRFSSAVLSQDTAAMTNDKPYAQIPPVNSSKHSLKLFSSRDLQHVLTSSQSISLQLRR